MTAAKPLNSEPERSICSECMKDRGLCLYCQITYQQPMSLHRHIAKMHPDTIRAENCDD